MKPVVRAITGFVDLVSSDLSDNHNDAESKVATCARLLTTIQKEFEQKGYVVQTLRLATNPFGEWLLDHPTNASDSHDTHKKRLQLLDTILSKHEIHFCSLGPAMNTEEASACCDIVSTSSRLCCSMNVNAGDVKAANAAADIILKISGLGTEPNAPQHLQGGLGNFQFCAASNCKPFIPFFPAAKSSSGGDGLKFAIGLENGPVIHSILRETRSVARVSDHFANEYSKTLLPLQTICETIAKQNDADFLGIDNSLNPSLATGGSIAGALEELEEVSLFGGPGTTSATAQLTVALQSLPEIKLTGYCGVMLPVCEDTRLAELTLKSDKRKLQISDLLLVSTVCGVGLDTIPLPGECPQNAIKSMILDVAGVAGRWNKSLSCRLLPVPGLKAGDMTQFESPYLINAQVFSVD